MINFEQDKKELKNVFEALNNSAVNLQGFLNSFMATTKLTPEQEMQVEKAKQVNLESLKTLQEQKNKIQNDFNKQS